MTPQPGGSWPTFKARERDAKKEDAMPGIVNQPTPDPGTPDGMPADLETVTAI